jgi:hypothetical protein
MTASHAIARNRAVDNVQIVNAVTAGNLIATIRATDDDQARGRLRK